MSRWLVLLVVLTACGGAAPFSLNIRDSQPEEVAKLLSLSRAPTSPKTNQENSAYVVTRELPRKIIRFDLVERRAQWTVPASVQSRLTLGPDLLVHVDDDGFLVARERKNGAIRWRFSLGGKVFIGAAVGAHHVFVVTSDAAERNPTYRLEAWDAKAGHTRWQHESDGLLGAPILENGVVAVPLFYQWLVFIDESTGRPLARLRSADEQIEFVRAERGRFFFGSKNGVRLVDARAVSARRETSTHAHIVLPVPLARATYDRHAFEPVEASYSAYDRTRILWRAQIEGDQFSLANASSVIQMERYLFALDNHQSETSSLTWARRMSAPVVTAYDTGATIVYATADGIVGTVEPRTGAMVTTDNLGVGLLGATFDADGFHPNVMANGPANRRAELLAIARDRDARYRGIQAYAVAALAQSGGAEAATDLITLIDDVRVADPIRQAAKDALIAQRDGAAFPVLLAALKVEPSFVSDRRPQAVAAAAKALAALGSDRLSPAEREQAVVALGQCLVHPATDRAFLAPILQAIQTLDAGTHATAVRDFLLTYRTDPEFASDPGALLAAIDYLFASGDVWNREVIAFTAADARSQSVVRDYARAVLAR